MFQVSCCHLDFKLQSKHDLQSKKSFSKCYLWLIHYFKHGVHVVHFSPVHFKLDNKDNLPQHWSLSIANFLCKVVFITKWVPFLNLCDHLNVIKSLAQYIPRTKKIQHAIVWIFKKYKRCCAVSLFKNTLKSIVGGTKLTHKMSSEVDIISVKSSLLCFVEMTLKSVKLISGFMLILLSPPLDHVFTLICLGQGAHSHGRVNALRAQHIALLSLIFLFTLLVQCPAATQSEGRHVTGIIAESDLRLRQVVFLLLLSFPLGFPLKTCTTGTMTWTKPHRLVCCNCRIMFVNTALKIHFNLSCHFHHSSRSDQKKFMQSFYLLLNL